MLVRKPCKLFMIWFVVHCDLDTTKWLCTCLWVWVYLVQEELRWRQSEGVEVASHPLHLPITDMRVNKCRQESCCGCTMVTSRLPYLIVLYSLLLAWPHHSSPQYIAQFLIRVEKLKKQDLDFICFQIHHLLSNLIYVGLFNNKHIFFLR